MKNPTSIFVDDSLWPLVTGRFVGTPSLPEFAAYLDLRLRLLRRGPHVAAVDLNQAGVNTGEQRQCMAAWMGQHEELMRERLLGTAYAISSDSVRLTLSIIFHLRPPVSPYVMVRQMPQAVEWALRKLEEAGQSEASQHIRHQSGLLVESRPG
jgi:hypothetical protein